ncbi:MAG TPA: DUF6065 family protein [Drouetiella sp.]
MNDEQKRREQKRPPSLTPPVNIPDTLVVPPNTIYAIPDQMEFLHYTYLEKCTSKRSWFSSNFYNCLPIVFGNQHGFLLIATHSFVCRWSGSNAPDGVAIHALERPERDDLFVTSHFGHGIITVQCRHHFRTPKGVNMMVKAPPNYPVHGCTWMDAIVETDNLRRDFTFNIKITRPQMDILFEKGTPLGCILPYPRYFLDEFKIEPLTDPVELKKAIETTNNFFRERIVHRNSEYILTPQNRYMEGKDIYDNYFDEHQKTLDGGAWWQASGHVNTQAAGCPVHKHPPAEASGSAAAETQNESTDKPQRDEKPISQSKAKQKKLKKRRKR